MTIAVVYDPRFHTFESWAALMCEAYAGQQLPIGVTEQDWQDFASGMKGIDTFASQNIPDPYVFNNWQDWAQAVVNAVQQRL